MKILILKIIIVGTLVLGGFAMIVAFSNWFVAIGTFALIWANNFNFKTKE